MIKPCPKPWDRRMSKIPVAWFASISCAWLSVMACWATPSRAQDAAANKPPSQTVSIVTDLPGFAPEEVERDLSHPVELALSGLADVVAVRSASGVGRSVVWVDFPAGADLRAKRQAMAEKLHFLQEQLPHKAQPRLAPLVARDGARMMVAVTAAGGAADAVRLRIVAESLVRPRLLAIPGVANVNLVGGQLPVYQIVASPDKLLARDVTLLDLTAAVSRAAAPPRGGIQKLPDKEVIVRIGDGNVKPDDLANAVVATRAGTPIYVRDLAAVRLAASQREGEASVSMPRGEKTTPVPAVVLAIQRSPDVKGERLVPEIQQALKQLASTLPPQVKLLDETFGAGDLAVALRGPSGKNAEWSRLSERAESVVARVPDVQSVWRVTGSLDDLAPSDLSGAAWLIVRTSPRKPPGGGREAPQRPREQLISDVRRALRDLPGVAASVGPAANFPSERSQVVLKILGDDLEVLQALAREALARLGKVPGVVDQQVDPQGSAPQLRIEIDRESAARYGIATSEIAEAAETASLGRVVGQVVSEGQRRDVIVTYDSDSRASPGVIGKTLLATPTGERVPLAKVVKMSAATGPAVIYREDLRRRLIVACNVEGRKPSEVIAAAKRALEPLELPPGYLMLWNRASD